METIVWRDNLVQPEWLKPAGLSSKNIETILSAYFYCLKASVSEDEPTRIKFLKIRDKFYKTVFDGNIADQISNILEEDQTATAEEDFIDLGANLDHIGDDIAKVDGDWGSISKSARKAGARAFNNYGFIKNFKNLCLVQRQGIRLWMRPYVVRAQWNWDSENGCAEDLKRMCAIYDNWYVNPKTNHKPLLWRLWKGQGDTNPDVWLIINELHSSCILPPVDARVATCNLEPPSKSFPSPLLTIQGLNGSVFNPAFWQTSGTVCSPDMHKVDQMACILSYKSWDPGHKFRIQLLHHLESIEFYKFSVFGCDNYHNLKSYLFTKVAEDSIVTNKEQYIYPYKYYLAVENRCAMGYVTEKLIEPILYNALPFYWGAPDISNYPIPAESYILLNPDSIEESAKIIMQAIRNNEWEKRKSSINAARLIILNKLSLPKMINNFVGESIV